MDILVVDNEECILQLVRRMLHNQGHRVFATTDAHQAIETIERDNIDLLISDIVMPAMTGPELAATVRRLRPGTSVLYMSGTDKPAGSPTLVKPFQTQDLIDAVDKVDVKKSNDPA